MREEENDVERIPRELIRELIISEKFQTTEEVLTAIKEMFAGVLEEILEVEMDAALGYDKQKCHPGSKERGKPKNYRNGHTKKTIKTQLGNIEIKIPRDRNGEFSPQIIGKYSRNADGMEEKILALYSTGMSHRDIAAQMKTLYGIEISPELVSNVSKRILPQIADWQARPLYQEYPFVFTDTIRYKVRENGQVISKDAYVILGINKWGYKELFGIWIRETDSHNFWLSVMHDLRSRGVKSVNLFCVDSLTGIREAIQVYFPKTDIQRCIIHQIRSSTKFVNGQDHKAFAAGLKPVYSADTEEAALRNLKTLEDKWRDQYPLSIQSWEENWDILRTFYKYPPEIRKIIYTTNIFESLHRQFRKVTKTKGIFPNDQSLIKMLYMVTQTISNKWTKRYQNWDSVFATLNGLWRQEKAG